MTNLEGLVSVVSQLREQRTNLLNDLKRVDAALFGKKETREEQADHQHQIQTVTRVPARELPQNLVAGSKLKPATKKSDAASHDHSVGRSSSLEDLRSAHEII